jgi:hypothetical protein
MLKGSGDERWSTMVALAKPNDKGRYGIWGTFSGRVCPGGYRASAQKVGLWRCGCRVRSQLRLSLSCGGAAAMAAQRMPNEGRTRSYLTRVSRLWFGTSRHRFYRVGGVLYWPR